ncbi:hypothetical protein [Aquimarina sp. RZ0]|uniref:hypothetical protein n=1 Tax=Aquimarina sp. RZ0 TaxID=2607730 RepID=UPI0011F32007|nr:hypothetical protein [Aquimarina sp. RZ0]KAA1242570.1 hypothetical protein F0000_24945 [Aquimarina sp. RZ0]
MDLASENSMGRTFFRKIGIKRAETTIDPMNLTYNMFRKIQLTKQIVGTCAQESISKPVKH